MIPDLIRALDRVVVELDRLRIPYVIGGSLASSAHGEPRPSGDVDLVVDLSEERANGMISAVAGEFYVPETAVREAVSRRTSFNLIHQPTVVKLDFFVMGEDLLRRLQIERGRPASLDPGVARSFQLSTAEDIVLQKLDWFRRGGLGSDRQWRDVLGVLKLQSNRLDLSYLTATAALTGLSELLARARSDAGV